MADSIDALQLQNLVIQNIQEHLTRAVTDLLASRTGYRRPVLRVEAVLQDTIGNEPVPGQAESERILLVGSISLPSFSGYHFNIASYVRRISNRGQRASTFSL